MQPGEFDQEVEEQFQPEEEPEQSETTEEQEEQPEPEPEPQPVSEVDILGHKLRQNEAEALIEFYEWARANPQQVAEFDRYLRGDVELVPRGGGQTPDGADNPSDDSDLEDLPPAVRAKLGEIDAMRETLGAMTQEAQQRQLVQAQAAVEKGAENFRTRLSLTAEDMTELQAETASLGILPSIAQRRQGDLTGAVEEALEIAYWRSEKFRQAAIGRMMDQQKEDRKRQRKASSLGGSSGSVPRSQDTPRDPEARKKAMADEIAEAMAERSIP